ncbi:MAG: Do family serine endopeptidase [Atribacterota bacterium]|nr:Do family serine endopeptidase [Atribacterota bacterium]MDD4895941.1 Do family serine endopeptidase [Atribacterota bacterium]MDD5637394.1 Do family serine endopeptidase [Atribacterota bacterium]
MLKNSLIKKQKIYFTIVILTFMLMLTSNMAVFAVEDQLTIQSLSGDIAEIAERVGPAVVNIDVMRYVETSPFRFRDPVFEWFFEQREEFRRRIPQKGAGSGFIVDKEGYVLTNEHVVSGAEEIKVTLSDGREFKGKVVGSDVTTDMAIVKIDANNLPVVELGDSDELRVGEIVIAIGNPYGLEKTVTMGVVSAKGRNISAGTDGHEYSNLIQTDTAINPGNSGGPLLNTKGEVVGINTAIIPYAQGIGFAIPVNIAQRNLDDLITLGKVRRAWLGVYIQEVTPEIAEQFNLDKAEGVLIADVIVGGPAEESGLSRGDIILSVNDQIVNTPQELQDTIRALQIGDKATLQVKRDGKEVSFVVKIGEMPADETITTKEKVFTEQTGIKVEEVTPEIAREAGLPRVTGLVITDVIPGSSADDMGLRSDDIILEANRNEVSTIEDWEDIINKLTPGDTLLLLIFRNNRTYYVPLKIVELE